jgi:CheY-like chemotaxis protein
VPDGEAALAAVRRRPPDLVLADVMMPRLDGFGLIQALRADERTRFIPVILLSARAGEESRIEGMEAGADDYLVKPFGARELLARVDAHLKMARLRREGELALRDSEAKLAIELADTQLLQRVSSSLIRKNNIDALYGQLLDAARSLMRSDMASLQMLSPERNKLFLLAQQGFHPESAKFWEWVRADDTTTCGVALAHGEAVIIPDVEVWDLVAGTETLSHFRLCGIRAVLSSPLRTYPRTVPKALSLQKLEERRCRPGGPSHVSYPTQAQGKEGGPAQAVGDHLGTARPPLAARPAHPEGVLADQAYRPPPRRLAPGP